MFGNNNKKKDSGNKAGTIMPSSSGHSLNSLVEGTQVEGTIKSTSDIRIDGKIKGVLTCEAKVIIGPTGHIDGEIRCQNAVVEGHFTGNLFVAELLDIRETASVSGEVSYGKLRVQSGAQIDGSYQKVGKNSNGSSKDAKNIIKGAKRSDAQNIAGKTHLKKETAN